MRAAAKLVLVLLIIVFGCAGAEKPSVGQSRPQNSGDEEKAMIFSDITPEQAKAMLDSDPSVIYLDVRTVPEFVAGHAPGAYNIPVAELNPATGKMELNAAFTATVAAHLPKDAMVVVGCKTGGRSTTACELLRDSGYTHLHNIVGGFAGMTDASGDIVKDGWSTLRYPIERGDGGERSFSTLSRQ